MRVYLGPIYAGPRKVEVRVHDYDTWNVNHTLALIVVPLLEAYLKHPATQAGCWGVCMEAAAQDMGYANSLQVPEDRTEELWASARARQAAIMDKMLYAFRTHASDVLHEEDPRVQEGLVLFAEHFGNLWN